MRRAALFVLAIPLSALAADDFFENQVRPLLASRCYACHAQTASGGLRLDSRDGLMKGGHRGVAVRAGDAEGSLLMQALRGTGGLKAMPPGVPLAATEIAIFEPSRPMTITKSLSFTGCCSNGIPLRRTRGFLAKGTWSEYAQVLLSSNEFAFID